MIKKKLVRKAMVICGIVLLGVLIDLPLAKNDTIFGEFNFYKIPILSDIWQWGKDQDLHLGLDLKGGTSLEYRLDMSKVDIQDKNSIAEGVKEVIENRVNALGVAETNVYSQIVFGEPHIIVEIPGVKNIDEAIKMVGKTVALEFKTEKDNYSEEELNAIQERNKNVETKALEVLDKTATEDFESLQKAFSDQESPLTDFITADKLPADFAPVFSLKKGEVYNQLINVADTYRLVKVVDKKTDTETKEIPKKVKASHILIAYKGAKRADKAVVRTKEEALKLAENVYQEVITGEKTFSGAVAVYSNDPTAKANFGNLGFFSTDKMVKPFADKAFSMGKGEISQPVETDFGYHIIQVNDIKETSTKEVIVDSVKIAEIIFNKESEKPLNGWIETGLGGSQFKRADVTYDNIGNAQVSILFNEEGAKLFAKLTKENLQKRVAIFLDGKILTAPTVQAEITNGEAVITGNYSIKEAITLAKNLNTGAIPAPIRLVAQNNIGPTLGMESFNSGIKAGLIGFILVMIYMILYYRLSGLIAVIALTIYGILLLAVIKFWPITMTLAGVAGIILSVGMAVDANILVFERIKEELKVGKPLENSMEIGYKRAWSAIRDSNISTLMTALILFVFGTGIVRWFAVTLSLGIVISLFTALTVTKTIMFLLVNTKLKEKIGLWL